MPNSPLKPLVESKPQASHAVAPAVDWFQRAAPRLTEEAVYRRYFQEPLPDEAGVQRARFQTVEQLRWAEKQAQLALQQEPDEIVQLRARALEEAEQIVLQAQLKAQEIQEQAYHKAYAQGRSEGAEAGYAEGYRQGETRIRSEVQAQFSQEQDIYRDDIQKFLDYVESERIRTWEQFEPQIVRMVSDMVRHIIKIEVEGNSELVLSTIRNTLRRVVEGTSLRIRVNPQDLEIARSHRAIFLEMLDGIRHLEILEDRRVGKGGCVMETESGNIDARIETQMQTLGEILDRVQNDSTEAQ